MSGRGLAGILEMPFAFGVGEGGAEKFLTPIAIS
jgi:hypothetical protein